MRDDPHSKTFSTAVYIILSTLIYATLSIPLQVKIALLALLRNHFSLPEVSQTSSWTLRRYINVCKLAVLKLFDASFEQKEDQLRAFLKLKYLPVVSLSPSVTSEDGSISALLSSILNILTTKFSQASIPSNNRMKYSPSYPASSPPTPPPAPTGMFSLYPILIGWV